MSPNTIIPSLTPSPPGEIRTRIPINEANGNKNPVRTGVLMPKPWARKKKPIDQNDHDNNDSDIVKYVVFVDICVPIFFFIILSIIEKKYFCSDGREKNKTVRKMTTMTMIIYFVEERRKPDRGIILTTMDAIMKNIW